MIRHVVSRFTVAVSVAAIVLSLSATAVFAGEVTGNGKSLKVEDGGKWHTGLHARSLCAFSGLNDEITPEEPGKTQNWGTIPKEMRDAIGPLGFHPGMACNPNIGLDEH